MIWCRQIVWIILLEVVVIIVQVVALHLACAVVHAYLFWEIGPFNTHFEPLLTEIIPMIKMTINNHREDTTSPDINGNPDHKGRIISLSTKGRDITDQFVDTTARADTLDASRKANQVLLSRANAIDDGMTIQLELNQLTQ